MTSLDIFLLAGAAFLIAAAISILRLTGIA
jgi:hypothetical protein